MTIEAPATCVCGSARDADCTKHEGSRFRFRAHEQGRDLVARYSYDYLPGPPIVGSICVHTHAFTEAAA